MELPRHDDRRRTPPPLRRWLVHSALFLAFMAVAGTVLIWPQWIALEGARAAVETQQERQEEVTDSLEVARAINLKLREWQKTRRRVFLESETDDYPRLVRVAARQRGVRVLRAQVTDRLAPRWRSLTVRADMVREGADETTGEIQPREVRLVLTGDFASIYETIGTLCGQQQLFVPDRWDLFPTPGGAGGARQVRASLRATVFVVREAEEAPSPPLISGRIAADRPLEARP